MGEYKTSDGLTLRYTDRGKGLPVILIAGYGAPASSWAMQTKVLVKAGYRVLEYDRRCHGKSDMTSGDQSIERQAMDIHEYLAHLALVKKPVLVGQSMGGSAVMEYFRQYGDVETAGFVNIDSTVKAVNDDNWQYGLKGLTEETKISYFEALPNPIYAPLSVKAKLTLFMSALLNPKADLAATKPMLLGMADADFLDVLPQIRVPALFIAGSHSPMASWKHAEYAAEKCPNGRYLVVPDCGHAVTWEKPEEFNRILLDFLKQIW